VRATLSQQGGGAGGTLSREVPEWLGAAPTKLHAEHVSQEGRHTKVSWPIALADTGAGGRHRANSAQSRTRASLALDLLWAGYDFSAG
jgi:hypothetical protein